MDADGVELDDATIVHYNQNRLYDFEKNNQLDVSAENELRRNVKVCLRYLPRHLKENGLRNLCSQYGVVKHVLFWDTRNYAFVTFDSLSAAENAIRKINDMKTLGMRAEFSFDIKSNVNEICEEIEVMQRPPDYKDGVDFGRRTIRPVVFSHPKAISGDLFKFGDCATNEDYENTDLIVADPHKEFINQIRHSSTASNERKRIVNGRSVVISNDAVLQKVKIKSVQSAGISDMTKSLFSFRNTLLPDPSTLTSSCPKCGKVAYQYSVTTDDKQPKCTCELGNVESTLESRIDGTVVALPSKSVQPNTTVKLVSVVNFRTVYVRPSSRDDEVEFMQLLNDIAKAAKKVHTTTVPKVGLLVLAPFENVLHRALILKLLNEETAIVAFLDFGNVDTVKVAQMKTMPAELKAKPRLITKFTLKNVPHPMFNKDLEFELFQPLVDSSELTVHFDEPYVIGKTECELQNASFGSLNDSLVANNVPFKEPDNLNEEIERAEREKIDFVDITGQNVSTLILHNASLNYGDVSVIKSVDINMFQRNHAHIQTFAEYLHKQAHITPRLWQYCIVQNVDDEWYRAQAIDVQDDGYVTVLFIDYGNVNIFPIERLRKLFPVLMFPCITATVACFELDTNEISAAIETKRKELLPMMSQIDFVKLSMQDNDPSGAYEGVLPADIYQQINQIIEDKNEGECTAEEPVDN